MLVGGRLLLGKLAKTTVALRADAASPRRRSGKPGPDLGSRGPIGARHLEAVQATGGRRGRRLLPLGAGNCPFGPGTPGETAERLARTLFLDMSFSFTFQHFKIAGMKKPNH